MPAAEPFLPWRIAGDYLESCNCDAICPCRMVGGIPGGRSTHGVCFGALSWSIENGHAGDVDLSGLATAIVMRYDDDEQGSPWQFVLHVDDRGDGSQREALTGIFLGRLGGEHVSSLPWIRKVSDLLDVRESKIELERSGRGGVLRVGSAVSLRATRPVETDESVACIVSGYHQPGTELTADELVVRDEPFEWELTGNCAFVSPFAYES